MSVPTSCPCCGRAFLQRERVLLAIEAGARDVDDVVRLTRVPRRHVAPLVARLKRSGLARGRAGEWVPTRRPRPTS